MTAGTADPRDLRLIFIGDSFVNGTADPSFLGWAGRLCAQAGGARELTCYNLGIRRDTSAGIAARWRTEAERRVAPGSDARLVFSFGANDTVMELGRRRVEEAASFAHFTGIIAAASHWLPTLVIGPPAVTDRNPRNANHRIAALSEGFTRRSRELGVPYLDLFTPLSRSADWQRAVEAGDGVHPDAAGYDLIAAIVSSWAPWRAWFVPVPATHRHTA